MPILVYAVEKPELPPFEMSARFWHDITYFVTQAGEPGVPEMVAEGAGGGILDAAEARKRINPN